LIVVGEHEMCLVVFFLYHRPGHDLWVDSSSQELNHNGKPANSSSSKYLVVEHNSVTVSILWKASSRCVLLETSICIYLQIVLDMVNLLMFYGFGDLKKITISLVKVRCLPFLFYLVKACKFSQSLSSQLHNNPSQKKNIIHLILHHPQLGAAVFGYNLSR